MLQQDEYTKMFLARYNPWRKTKREQLQSRKNLSFDPQKTDIDEKLILYSLIKYVI